MNRTTELPAKTDVVIIGGGVIGLCTAYELAARNRDVVVIDSGPILRGSSTGNAGYVVPSHVVPLAAPGVIRTALRGMIRRTGPVSLRWSARPDYLAWLIRFTRNCTTRNVANAAPTLSALAALSNELFDEWIAIEQIECNYRHDGLLDIYNDTRTFASLRTHAAQLQRLGVSVEVADATRVREIEPAVTDSVAGGIFFPNDASLHPGRFLSGLTTVLTSRGVELVSHTDALRVQSTGNTVNRLETSRGDIHVQHVVVAAGSWSAQVAKLFGESIPIQPGKGYSLTVVRPHQGPRIPLLLGDHGIAVSPMGDELRFTGRFELSNLDMSPSMSRLSQIETLVRSHLTIDAQLTVKDRWAGLRPTTPDGVPIIGTTHHWRNVTYATGHAMLGLSLGPATGRVTAQLVCGKAPDVDVSRCSPVRFQ